MKRESRGQGAEVSQKIWAVLEEAGMQIRQTWGKFPLKKEWELMAAHMDAGSALLDRVLETVPGRSSPTLRKAAARIRRMLTEDRGSFPPALKRALRALRSVLLNPEALLACEKDTGIGKLGKGKTTGAPGES